MPPEPSNVQNDEFAVSALRAELLRPQPHQFAPPTSPRIDSLPLRTPGWKGFERLILAVVRDVEKWRDVREYGVQGQNQQGIDLVAYASGSNEVRTCQCKDIKSLSAAQLREIVRLFNDDHRPFGSSHIAIAVSCPVEDATVIDELHLLRTENPGLTIELWGERQINSMLENQYLIVRRFFSDAWERAFCTPPSESQILPSEKSQQILVDFISRSEEASFDRLVTRWLASGIDGDQALSLANDRAIGRSLQINAAVSTVGFHLIEGDFGSGKSVAAERIHQQDLEQLRQWNEVFLPAHVDARAITGTVEDLCASLLERTSQHHTTAVRLIIDGLDEVGPTRADEIILSARSYTLRRASSRVLATIRPGLIRISEAIQQPLLSRDEAESLIERVSGTRYFLHNQPPTVADAVRRPLFALIAAGMSGSRRDIPRSTGGFLDELVNRALTATGRPRSTVLKSLESLAETIVNRGGGSVPVSEISSGLEIDDILATRLVAKSGRSIRFSLPIIEQYFAGLTLLKPGAVARIVHDLALLDKWRYGLVLAATVGSSEQIKSLLDELTPHHPGLAAWVVTEAVPETGTYSDVPLPDSLECARQIRHSFEVWTNSLRELSVDLGLYNDQGKLPTVGARSSGQSLTVAFKRHDTENQDGYETLPPEVGIFTRPSPWTPVLGGSGFPAEYGAWPWRLSIRWIRDGLESLCKDYTNAWKTGGAAAAEFHWLLARTLVNEASRIDHRPIEVARVLTAAIPWAERMKQEGYRGIGLNNARFTIYPEMLTNFIEKVEYDAASSDYIQRPYVTPDTLDSPGRWIWNAYSADNMHKLCVQVFEAAVSIYQDVCSDILSPLIPTLGLASLLPVRIQGTLEVSDSTEYAGAPTIEYCALPVERSGKSSVNISMGPLPAWNDDSIIKTIVPTILRLRPEAAPWATTSYHTWNFSAFRNRPATTLALNWLSDDLKRLGLVSSSLHQRDE